MPVFRLPAARLLSGSAGMVAFMAIASWNGAAHASEHAAPPASVAAAAESASSAAAKRPAKPGRSPETLGPGDPMDILRERLAQKLGAVKAPDTSNPNVMRVIAKSNSPEAVEHVPANDAPRQPPRRRSTPVAMGQGHEDKPQHTDHWEYAGIGGPDAWGQLKPEFAKCANGSRQSPIDIRDGIKVELDPVHFDYKPSAFRVIDNGHTVQVNVAAGNWIEVMGSRYELLQFHFHRPSEERIDGKQFDMVAHLVHKNLEGRLAVVAVLLARGSAQGIVQSVWNNLPLEKGEETTARTPLNLSELLPSERSYFTYMGSLTTPPCSEGVLWMVMKQPVQISSEQIGIFSRLYPMNARPVQSAAGRLIKESN